ncbi:MAG: thiamine pyrophosphate-dependent dehydrogenase E1 component subunit alpha [Bryobacterales bacterium]|nr:thiamine pyrophosphate-dependent dehydrogenase E1 component subunit alpha [Bryobacterales bacterium]
MITGRMAVDVEEMLRLYGLMVRIRNFELKMVEIFTARMKAGDFPGALHTYCGEEAIAVGVCGVLRPDDYVFSTHRGHGHALAKGADLNKMVAELNGRASGLSRGFGGSMHLYDPSIGFMGTTGVVGGNLPLCLGTAYASVALGGTFVTVAFFGEGAASQGSFHESVNMAAVMRWPVVYVCENNLYAATTHVAVNCPLENIADRAKGYGIPGAVVDGNDVLAVREAAVEAIERARSGCGPTLIECKTYRHHPHCMVIPEHRPPKECREWHAKDPIESFAASLMRIHATTRDTLDAIEAREVGLLEAAVKFMRESPLPDPATVGDYLWA